MLRATTRRAVRIRVHTRGALKSARPQLGHVEDLSETGMYFSCPRPLHAGDEVSVVFDLPPPRGDARVEVRAVVRHRSLKGGALGMGLQFLRMRYEHAQLIRAFVLWAQTQDEPLAIELCA
jgi:c-di-GMP-binding flagellar brake protein YcgR